MGNKNRLKKLRVGIVSLYFPPLILGGSPLSAYYITKGLIEKGHQVDVFTAKCTKKTINSIGGSKDNWRDKGVRVHEIFDPEYPFGIRSFFKPGKIARQLKQYLKKINGKFEILYAYGMNTISSVIYCKEFTEKTAAAINGNEFTSPYFHIDYKGDEYLHHNFFEFMFDSFMRIFSKKDITSGKFKWLKIFLGIPLYLIYYFRLNKLKKLDLILPISKKMKTVLEKGGISKSKLFVCHNLFEKISNPDSKFVYKNFNISKNEKVILFSGRISKIKGCHIIIKAIPQVIKNHPNVKFLFVGKDIDSEYLKKLAKDLGVEKYIIFGGNIKVTKTNLASLYNSSYLTVYPSIFFEPLGRTPMESILAGTPVIATNRGGLEDLVQHMKTGIIIKPNNEKNLADAIVKLLNDKRLYSQLIEGGKKNSKKFLSNIGIKNHIKTFMGQK